MMNDAIITRASEFVAATQNCVLAQIDENGYPTAATITHAKTEGIKTIFFYTGLGSNWARRAKDDSRASICFNSYDPATNVTLVGDIEILTDQALKREIWPDWMAHYLSGPEDPNGCVLKFRTRRYSIMLSEQEGVAKGTL